MEHYSDKKYAHHEFDSNHLRRCSTVFADFFRHMLESPIDGLTDREGYLIVKDVLSTIERDEINQIENDIICEFSLWAAERFPLTSVAIGGYLAEKLTTLNRRSSAWGSELVRSFLKTGVTQDYQAIAIADMVSKRASLPYLKADWHLEGLIVLSAMAYGAIDRIPFYHEHQKDQKKQFIEASFCRLSAYQVDISSLHLYSDSLLRSLGKNPDKEAQKKLVHEIINPMTCLFEHACSRKMMWASYSYSSTLAYMSRIFKMFSDQQLKGEHIPHARYQDPDWVKCSILKTLKLPAEHWKHLFKLSKGETKYQCAEKMAFEAGVFIKTINGFGLDDLTLKDVMNNVATVALQGMFDLKSKHPTAEQVLIGRLFPLIDFVTVRDGLSRGARKMLTEYAIKKNPELIVHLDRRERGNALEDSLGL